LAFRAKSLADLIYCSTAPSTIIAQGTDWRFFNELKHELKSRSRARGFIVRSSHSIAFKWQVAQEFIAEESLYAQARNNRIISSNLLNQACAPTLLGHKRAWQAATRLQNLPSD
jgi:hypothetical protein